jgi:threonine/homoserine/homoserine lactone efflux protein
MGLDIVLAFAVFAFVTSVTPGPNNLMLLASGMNFGFRASVPHVLGIGGGFFCLLIAVGMGLGGVFARYPQTYEVLKWVGAAYLLYLAWGIAASGAPVGAKLDEPARRAPEQTRGRPLGFLGAALFQWVNPKAWAMAVGAYTAYVPATSGWELVAAAAFLFAAINAPCVSLWALFGSRLRRWLMDPAYRRVFNVAMAVLLVGTLIPLFQRV